jgi:hypothetical protein
MCTLTPAAAPLKPGRGVSLFGPVPGWTRPRFLSAAAAARPNAYSQMDLIGTFNITGERVRIERGEIDLVMLVAGLLTGEHPW